MQVDPHNVFRLLGVDAGRIYPTAVDCPICSAGLKLEIRSPLNITCRACHFTGDIIELLAAKRGEPILGVVKELQLRSLADFGRESIEQYVREHDRQQKLKDLIARQAQAVREQQSGSLNAIFDLLNARHTSQILHQLLPHVCQLRRTDLSEAGVGLPKTAREAWTWWGRYTALAIPAWDQADVAGLWLLTTKGANFFPLRENVKCTAFAKVPSFSDSEVVVIDDIALALRMTLWSIFETGRPRGFVVPYGIIDDAEHWKCGRIVYWTPRGETRHYVRALRVPSAQTLDHTDIGKWDVDRELPCDGSFGVFQKRLDAALPAHQALAYHLTTFSAQDARTALCGARIEPADRAKVVSYVQGDDARHVGQLFTDAQQEVVVSWAGESISDTPEGWMVKGKIISSVKFYIDQVRPQGETGEALVLGTIDFTAPSGDRHNLRFREKLSAMRDTAKWLQARVVSATGCIPFIDGRWSKKLIEVAQQFHVPKPVLADQQYGWYENRLRMPNFMVDANGVHTSSSLMEGPALPVPAPLSDAEWSAWAGVAFCRVALALLGNLWRTAHGRPGIGLMLTNEPHIVSRLAAVLGVQTVPSPTAAQIEEQALLPIPMFTEWSPAGLRRMFNETAGYRNIVLNVDSRTARLACISPDWVRLRVGTAIDYGALRGVFHLLPRLLRMEPVFDDDGYYSSIATILVPEVGKRIGGRTNMHSAALDLDQHYICRNSTAATRIMELVFYGIDRDEIRPEVSSEGVRVRFDQFLAATASPTVPMMPLDEMTERLQEARFLCGQDADAWIFNRSTWDLNASLLRA